jgi:hypothetical protein
MKLSEFLIAQHVLVPNIKYGLHLKLSNHVVSAFQKLATLFLYIGIGLLQTHVLQLQTDGIPQTYVQMVATRHIQTLFRMICVLPINMILFVNALLHQQKAGHGLRLPHAQLDATVQN